MCVRRESLLSLDPVSVTPASLQLEAYGLYCALMPGAASVDAGAQETEPSPGGKLLYAGELDARGRAMVIAGNVSGCATLAAIADLDAQKLVIREGVVDFVVTSLDEALRILKNEIRKRATVAVCVGASPAAVELEMVERGVLPDLVFVGAPGQRRSLPNFGFGSREIQCAEPDPNLTFLTWQVAQAPARWMAKLDAIALDCLSADWRARRWLRIAPRYCGRSEQARRSLYCEREAADQIIKRFAAQVHDGAIETAVSASVVIGGATKVFQWPPVTTA